MPKKPKNCNHRLGSWDAFAQYCADGELYDPRIVDGPRPVAWKCLKCGDYASLGEANDVPRNVAIEIMAAEIAADMLYDGSVEEHRGGWQFGWWLWGDEEESKRLDHWSPTMLPDGTYYGDGYLSHYPNWQAGWLARVIDRHDETLQRQALDAKCVSCGAALTPSDPCLCWALYPG